MKLYFVTTGLWEEVQVIRKVRPPRLLCSYWYFKARPLDKFCEDIDYHPEILLDSGAYSAYTKDKRVNVLDYIDYIRANRAHVSEYITLDVIGDPHTTYLLWELMKKTGLDPLPVVHYGTDLNVMGRYLDGGVRRIALGSTVPVRDKSSVAGWCADIKKLYPEAKLHLLGSSSQAILRSGALESCDSSTWYMQAVMGRPTSIPGKDREAKMSRAEINMRGLMEVFDEDSVPVTNYGVEPADCKV